MSNLRWYDRQESVWRLASRLWPMTMSNLWLSFSQEQFKTPQYITRNIWVNEIINKSQGSINKIIFYVIVYRYFCLLWGESSTSPWALPNSWIISIYTPDLNLLLFLSGCKLIVEYTPIFYFYSTVKEINNFKCQFLGWEKTLYHLLSMRIVPRVFHK